MKYTKLFSCYLIFIVSIFTLLTGCTKNENVLNVYSWADNIDPEVIKDFENKYNVKVNYDVYSSNEELLAKLQTGKTQYDLIQPSDYMVGIMMKLNLLEELNKDNIPNITNVVSSFQTPPFDPGSKHSIVYTWGVTGIAYNKNYVQDNINSWSDLWNSNYKDRLVLLNDSREVIGMALKKNAFSNSTTNLEELKTAGSDLQRLLPNVLAFDTDTIKQKFIAEEAWIGTVWSGDAAYIHEENPNVEFVIPEEGATIWADTMAIPKGAQHKELAEKFINYLLEPEVSVKNYEAIGYSNPNEKAYPLHSEEYRSNKMIFLEKQDLERTEWLVEVGERLKDYDQLWTELKSGKE